MANFNLDDYIQVNERIEKFYERFPNGSIQTEVVSNQDGQAIIKAYAYRTPDDPRPCTGHAMEKEGSTYINKTSHIENCETSAVGRALAMLGFEIKKSVASREEVANARLNQKPTPPQQPVTKPTTTQTGKDGWTGFGPTAGDKALDKILNESFQNSLAKLNELQAQLGSKTEAEFVVRINAWIDRAAKSSKGAFEPFEIKALADLEKVDSAIVSKLIESLIVTAAKMRMGAK